MLPETFLKRDYLLVGITSSWLSPMCVQASALLLCLSDLFVHILSARRAPTSQIHARRCSCTASSWRFQPETYKRGYSSCLTSSWSIARRKTGVSWPSFVHHPADKTTQRRRWFLKLSLPCMFLKRQSKNIMNTNFTFPPVSVLLHNI